MTTSEYLGAIEGGRFPDPRMGPWEVVVHWAAEGERVFPAGIEVKSLGRLGKHVLPVGEEYERLTSTVLRQVPLARCVEQSRQGLAQLAGPLARHLKTQQTGREVQLTQQLREPEAKQRRGRRLEHDDDHYRHVSDLYREALRAGRVRAPAKYVKERLEAEGRFYSREQVRKWIAEARKRDYLAPASRAATEKGQDHD